MDALPDGLWTKCPTCATMLFDKELDDNLKVCMKCNHHFAIGSRERIHSLVETCKANGVDPYVYLVSLFQKLPTAQTADDYEALLPWRLTKSASPI